MDAEGLGVYSGVGQGGRVCRHHRGVSGISGDNGSGVGGDYSGAGVSRHHGAGVSHGGHDRAVGNGSNCDGPLLQVVVARQSLGCVVGGTSGNYFRGVEGNSVDGIQDDSGGVRSLSEGDGGYGVSAIYSGYRVDRWGRVDGGGDDTDGRGAVHHAGAVLRHRAGCRDHGAVGDGRHKAGFGGSHGRDGEQHHQLVHVEVVCVVIELKKLDQLMSNTL